MSTPIDRRGPPNDMQGIDARLERELARFRSAPSAARRARVLARVQREAGRPADGRLFRWGAGLAAAGLLFALSLGLRDSPEAVADPVEVLARREAAAGAQLETQPVRDAVESTRGESGWVGLVRGGGADLRVALDEPLLDEARRLADDGARVAAALLQRLPGPLRHAISRSSGG